MLNPSIRDLRGVTLNHGMVRIITVPRCCLAQQRTKCVRSVSGHRAPRVRRTRRRTAELLTVERRDDRKLRDLAATTPSTSLQSSGLPTSRASRGPIQRQLSMDMACNLISMFQFAKKAK